MSRANGLLVVGIAAVGALGRGEPSIACRQSQELHGDRFVAERTSSSGEAACPCGSFAANSPLRAEARRGQSSTEEPAVGRDAQIAGLALTVAASACYRGPSTPDQDGSGADTAHGDTGSTTGGPMTAGTAGTTATAGGESTESGSGPEPEPPGKYPEPYPEPACPADSTTDELADYLDRWVDCHAEARTERISAMETAEDVYERQAYVRGRMLAEIGDFPERTPLNPRIVSTHERDGYRVENIIYESQPGFFVTANLYVPTTGEGPFPAMLALAGHSGAGKGGTRHPSTLFANRGFVVLAYDPPGQGERVDVSNPHLTPEEHGSGTTEHTMYGVLAELTGQNYARHEVWDGIRGIDYLFTRPEVDQSVGVGVYGCSGGGTQSAFMAAFDTRVSASAPACFMTKWRPEWVGYIDAEQAWTDFVRDGLDFSDYPLAMAPQPGESPRAFKILHSVNDYISIEGTRATAAEAKEFYRLIGKEEQFDFFENECDPDDADCTDTHGWKAVFNQMAIEWLEQWLRGGPPDVISSNPIEPASVCTSTGQVMTAPEISEYCEGVAGSCPKTVHTLTLERAEQLYADRTIVGAADAAEVREIVGRRIHVGAREGTPEVTQTEEVEHSDYREERLTIETEPGFTVPAVLLVPSAGASQLPAVIYIDRISDDSLQEAEEIVRSGRVVLVVQPRGSELAPHRLVRGVHVGSDYLQNTIASVVGKRLVGLRVTDALRAFDYLITRTEVDPSEISVFGRDEGGITALHAGVLEPSFRAIAAENALLSYMNLVQTKNHYGFNDLILPGVLQDYDLPDLANASSPRPVWISSPRRADTPLAQPSPDAEPASEGTPASLAEAEATYTPPGAPASVHVLLRDSSSFMDVYEAWLE